MQTTTRVLDEIAQRHFTNIALLYYGPNIAVQLQSKHLLNGLTKRLTRQSLASKGEHSLKANTQCEAGWQPHKCPATQCINEINQT